MKKKIFKLLVVFTSIAILHSCTKLEEEILDEVFSCWAYR